MLDESFLRLLACPMDHTALSADSGMLVCAQGHRFSMEQGVPIFTSHPRREPIPLNMPPCPRFAHNGSGQLIDAFVDDWIVNTNGNLYWGLRGRLPRYPIPDWPFGSGAGKTLLDIGCSWGRWCLAASSRGGFRAIGTDVHIDALAAATRVSRQLKTLCNFICSDADALPVQSRSIDCVFSYSVLQHIDRNKVLRIFHEIARVLKTEGRCIIQLPNTLGPLSLLQQFKRGFREAQPGTFEMRYWSAKMVRKGLAEAGLRDIKIYADGFLSQNPQLSDLDLLTPTGKLIVLASHIGRKTADAFPIFARVADSLWIEAQAPSEV